MCDVVETKGGNLQSGVILHTVGPVWDTGTDNETENLYTAIYNCLLKATQMGLQSIAIPAVSSGIYKFPIQLCTTTIIKACHDFCVNETTTLTGIHLADTREQVVREFMTNLHKGIPRAVGPSNTVVHIEVDRDYSLAGRSNVLRSDV